MRSAHACSCLLLVLGCGSSDDGAAAGSTGESGGGSSGAATAADEAPPPGDDGGIDDGPPPTTDPSDPATGPADDDGGSDEGVAPDDCCSAHAEPSCSDDATALCVCEVDASCCVTGWTEACVAAAASCGACGGDEGSTGAPEPGCAAQTIELEAADATLDGDWQVVPSEMGEGMVAYFPPYGYGGGVQFDIDVPCDDTWHVWVRALDAGEYDALWVTADEGDGGVFEADCTPNGEGYVWHELNRRDPMTAPECEYTDDPWTMEWATGAHTLRFEHFESWALARIVVTNDPTFAP